MKMCNLKFIFFFFFFTYGLVFKRESIVINYEDYMLESRKRVSKFGK